MSARVGSNPVVRKARTADIEGILDLLTHYDQDQAYFEPWYLDDPTYRPEQSWVVEQDRQLIAHLRVFDRQVRIGSGTLRIAGMGNVVTARERRGQGYARLLLRVVIEALVAEGYAYSLLWTHLPELYRRFGWVPIDEIELRATLPPTPTTGVQIEPFRDQDLADVMALYERTNVARTGTAIRSQQDWSAQLARSAADTSWFLLARSSDGELVGSTRGRSAPDATEITELAVCLEDRVTARALLSAVSGKSGGRLYGHFPPSLWTLLDPTMYTLTPDPGLMGRVLDPKQLVRSLGPVWSSRFLDSGQETSFAMESGDGAVSVWVTPSAAHLTRDLAGSLLLDEARFARLLFYGIGKDDPGDHHRLEELFPPQDFVIWGVDSF